MPQQSWTEKEERQYRHIKSQAMERGSSEDRAEEIAARTVNKNRAQAGESRQRSKTATQDIPPQRRGGLRSGSGPGGRTKQQLYADAQRADIKGRSKMTKAELERALQRS
ncbi:plasmid stabilization protein [Saccharopolyspora sp. NPDC000995]